VRRSVPEIRRTRDACEHRDLDTHQVGHLRPSAAGIEQLLGRIRVLRARQLELSPYSAPWYESLREEAAMIAELRARAGIPADRADTVEWLLAGP
jgi:hypothetical protein